VCSSDLSALVDIDEIRENDYNLNVPRYVDILPEEDPVDIEATLKHIKLIQTNRKDLESEFEKNMKELGY
jgi:type I restriction enzyme M protein